MLRILRTGNKRTKAIWWALISAITVVTFVGGFVFLLGSGLGNGATARATGAIGTVDDQTVSRDDYQNALAEQRETYKRQYGTDPADRDLKMLEVQTWRSLVYQRLLSAEAKRNGIKVSDPEVVMALKVSPPTMLQNAPAFQTDGKFDYAKYQQALANPNNDWSGFEQMMREQLPTRKFQERMIASIKVPEPELQQAYHQRMDRVDATVVQVGPDMAGEAPKIGDAELQKTYEKHKGRFTAAAHTDISPWSGRARPKSNCATSVRPDPTRPARPRISPLRTESETPRTRSSRLWRFRAWSAISPISIVRFGKTAAMSRPTIMRINSSRFTWSIARVPMVCPSRSTVTRFAIAAISSSRWEIYMIPTPSCRNWRMTANRRSTSRSDNDAVGSSMMRMRAPAPIAFAISTTCCSGMLRVSTTRSGSIEEPLRFRRSIARCCRSFQFTLRQRIEDSKDSPMFSAIVRWGNSDGC